MSSLHEVTGKNHLSYSSVKNYANCGEMFRLERVVGIATTGNWAMFAGKVFHLATEYLDNGSCTLVEEALDVAWNVEAKEIDDMGELRGGGKNQVENGDYWREHLPLHLQGYVEWRDDRFEQGWEWLLIDDKPAIEFVVKGKFGEVEVLGFIDRAMRSPEGDVFVIDLKSGKMAPSREQLDVYADLMKQQYDISVAFGSYYMSRKSAIGDTFLMDRGGQILVDWWTTVASGITNEVFMPNPNPLCGICQVKPWCRLKGDPELIKVHSQNTSKGIK